MSSFTFTWYTGDKGVKGTTQNVDFGESVPLQLLFSEVWPGDTADVFLIIPSINENKETVNPLETSGFGLSLDWIIGGIKNND